MISQVDINLIIIIFIILHISIIYSILQIEESQFREKVILAVLLISNLFWVVFLFFQIELGAGREVSEIPLLEFSITSAFGHLFSTLTLVLFVLFINYRIHLSLSDTRVILLSGLTAFITIGSILKLIYSASENLEFLTFLTYLIYLAQFWILIVAAIFIKNDLVEIGKMDLNRNQQIQFNYLRYCLAILFLHIPVMLMGTIVYTYFAILLFPLNILSIYFIRRVYKVNPTFSFIVPKQTYFLMLIDHTGKLYHNYQFNPIDTEHSINSISKYVGTFYEFMSEFYGKLMIPKKIRLGDHKIIFRWSEDRKMILALFSSVETVKLNFSLQNLMRDLTSKYKKDSLWDIPSDKNFKRLIETNFTYLLAH